MKNLKHQDVTYTFKSDITDALLKRVRVFEKELQHREIEYEYDYLDEDRSAIFDVNLEEEGNDVNLSIWFSDIFKVNIFSKTFNIPEEKEKVLIEMLSPYYQEGPGIVSSVISAEYVPVDSELLEKKGFYSVSLGYTFSVIEGLSDEMIAKHLLDEVIWTISEEVFSLEEFFKKKGIKFQKDTE